MKKMTHPGLNRISQARSDLFYYLPLLVLILIILLFGHPAYSANDDYAMMSIASGAIDGIPDAHLIFTNSLIGEALKGLYTLVKTVNWYTFYLLATGILSQFLVLRAVLKVIRQQTVRLIALAVLLIFSASFLILFNFTTIAILTSFAGFCTLISETAAPSGKWWLKIVGVLLAVLGGLIRVQALLYTSILMLPVILLLGRVRLKRILPWLAFLILLTVGTVVYDQASYAAHSDWQSFKTYTHTRGEIHSTAKMAFGENDAFLAGIGWTKAAYSLFDNWIFIDDQVFTLQSLEAINAAYSSSLQSLAGVAATFGALLKLRWLEVILSLAVVGFSIFAFSRSGRRNLLIAIAIPVYIMLVNIAVTVFLRMVDNIFYPSLFIIAMLELGLMGVGTADKEFTRSELRILEILLLAFLLIKSAGMISIARQNRVNEVTAQSITQTVQQITGPRGTDLVILQASSFPDIWISAYSAAGLGFDALPTGWLINSPPYRHLLDRYGIGNPINAIGTRNDVLYLGGNQQEIIDYLGQMKNIQVNARELVQFEVNYKGHEQIALTRYGKTK